jgi:hypothetical protein
MIKLPPVRPTKRRKHEHRDLQSLLIRPKVNCRQYRRGLDLWCGTERADHGAKQNDDDLCPSQLTM